MDDRLYWIWMQNIFAPGSLKSDALLRFYGSAMEVYNAPLKELGQFGLTEAEIQRFSDKSLALPRKILSRALENGGWVLTPDDALYPSLLRTIPGIPLVLYGYGELPNLDLTPAIAIVGTRAVTSFGKQATALISAGLALGGAVVISGGAYGVDTAAHEAALAAGGLTIDVQGCGLDIDYPSKNSELRRRIALSGAVISEYPPGTPPLKHNFPLRNRIISGLSMGVCVTEAPEKSGALITARLALEQGRDVFAVAGDMLTGRSAGTDELIKRGAKLVTSAAEILEEYLPRFNDIINLKAAQDARHHPALKHNIFIKEGSAKPSRQEIAGEKITAGMPDNVSEESRLVFTLLDDTPKTMDELVSLSGLSAAKALTALTELELAGCATRVPGQGYTRC
ncbi:MAG TPA: DNA-protecting protein DprA [Clostridiales bacterium]|nr:DNA-protecting protein DprA [Clostridiales bacterium]